MLPDRFDMLEPLFRQAAAADVPTIVRLVNAANSGAGGTAGWTHEAHLFEGDRTDEAEVAQLLAAPGARFVLSLGAGQVIACAYLKVTGKDAYLGLLSVHPHRQGRGFGGELIAECERVAHDLLGCERLRITVITSHRPEVAAFYERRGFVRTGTFKEFERKQALAGKKVEGMRLEWMDKTLSAPAVRESRMRVLSTLMRRTNQGRHA
jgi:GNAT superfamily N-acetyltransferase